MVLWGSCGIVVEEGDGEGERSFLRARRLAPGIESDVDCVVSG